MIFSFSDSFVTGFDGVFWFSGMGAGGGGGVPGPGSGEDLNLAIQRMAIELH